MTSGEPTERKASRRESSVPSGGTQMLVVDASPADDDDLDLRAYLGVLRRRWKVIVLVIVVVVAAALAFSLSQERRYRAEAELLVEPQDSTSLLDDRQVLSASDAARALNNQVKLFESSAVVRAVEQAYDGPLDPEDVQAAVSSDTSDVIVASLVSTDPEAAADLVNLYVETFIDVRQTRRTDQLLAVGSQIQSKIDELTAELADVREPLTEIEAQLEDDPGNAVLAAQRDEVAADLSAQLTPLESQRAFYQNQLEDLELAAEVARSGETEVLTAAEPPDTPESPKPIRDAALALVLGTMLGVVAAFVVDALDERIRGASDLEEVTGGIPTLALVPEVEKGQDDGFVALRDAPRSHQAEAFRSLRTAVKFARVDRPVRIIQVSSPSQGEGKTTVVANLAMALAQGGDRVAVVCCDLRRPRVHDRFGVTAVPGFSDVLLGEATLASVLRHCDDGIVLVPAGTPSPTPSELLSSSKAEAVIRAMAEEFDAVVIDCTPVLPVTDALVVSRFVDATLLVADSRSTHRKAVRRALQLLDQVDAPVLGVVLNGLPEESSYGYSYGYMSTANAPTRRARRKPKQPV